MLQQPTDPAQAVDTFSRTISVFYMRYLLGRTVMTDINEARRREVEEAWAALVQRTPCWAIRLEDLGVAVEKILDKDSYRAEDLLRALRILDLNGDGLIDYFEFKAYMLTISSTCPDSSASGNGGASTNPFSVASGAAAGRGKQRRRRGGEAGGGCTEPVFLCEDLIMVGSRRLSDIFFAHQRYAIADFLPKAQSLPWAKARNPFTSLPNYDAELAAYIRCKSIQVARKKGRGAPATLQELSQGLAGRIGPIQLHRVGARLQAAAQGTGDGLYVASPSGLSGEGEEDGGEEDDREAEERHRRQQRLLKEEQEMMRKVLRQSSRGRAAAATGGGAGAQGAGGAGGGARGEAAAAAATAGTAGAGGGRVQQQQPQQPQQAAGGFAGVFKTLGRLFGGGNKKEPEPSSSGGGSAPSSLRGAPVTAPAGTDMATCSFDSKHNSEPGQSYSDQPLAKVQQIALPLIASSQGSSMGGQRPSGGGAAPGQQGAAAAAAATADRTIRQCNSDVGSQESGGPGGGAEPGAGGSSSASVSVPSSNASSPAAPRTPEPPAQAAPPRRQAAPTRRRSQQFDVPGSPLRNGSGVSAGAGASAGAGPAVGTLSRGSLDMQQQQQQQQQQQRSGEGLLAGRNSHGTPSPPPAPPLSPSPLSQRASVESMAKSQSTPLFHVPGAGGRRRSSGSGCGGNDPAAVGNGAAAALLLATIDAASPAARTLSVGTLTLPTLTPLMSGSPTRVTAAAAAAAAGRSASVSSAGTLPQLPSPSPRANGAGLPPRGSSSPRQLSLGSSSPLRHSSLQREVPAPA